MKFFKRNYFKTIVAVGTMVFFMSCSNEVIDSDGGLIDNSSIVTVKDVVNVSLETVSVEKINTQSLEAHWLGDYTLSEFGNVKAGFVSQITASSYPVQRTDSKTPLAVTTSEVSAFLEIPLDLSLNNSGMYELDNAIGDFSSKFNFKVSTFSNLLHRFDANTGDTRIYFSDNSFKKENELIKNTTGVDKELGNLAMYEYKEEYQEKEELLLIDLDNDYFKVNFIDKLNDTEGGDKITNEDQLEILFRGIKVTMEKTEGEGLIFPLSLSRAKLKIAFLNKEEGEDDKKDTLSFNLSEANFNLFTHDHLGINKEDKGYVQGVGGYETVVDISELINKHSTEFQVESNKPLMNQAKLRIYVEEDLKNEAPTLSKLNIFTVDEDKNRLADYSSLDENTNRGSLNGVVQYENVEEKTNPYVEFFITAQIKRALEDKNGEAKLFVLKADSSIDNIAFTTPKGIVLLKDKKPELEVIYSKR